MKFTFLSLQLLVDWMKFDWMKFSGEVVICVFILTFYGKLNKNETIMIKYRKTRI